MLVMPFRTFKAQGRIMKSTKAWRNKALAAGSLVEHEEGSGQIGTAGATRAILAGSDVRYGVLTWCPVARTALRMRGSTVGLSTLP